ncbi:MAG: glycosyltransferase family 4 protein, partial [Pseudobutyrivibrio sp.]|nr:glycosyltransferase family 4 protein [Pseudobutyrivibrio sp.]
ISATRMIVMPSLWEGFGLVALEGMCFGKPILATKVGGLKEIVNEECGILCDPTDIKPLVAEALRLMKDEAYYESKSCAATKRAEIYDNCATYVKGINDIYMDIINNSHDRKETMD